MTDHIQVFMTIDKKGEALRIAEHLLEKKLAACVQVIGPITSTYRWKGKMEQDEEWLCLMKTRKDLYGDVERAIKAVHSYEEPEILAMPVVAGSQGYLSWLDKQVMTG